MEQLLRLKKEEYDRIYDLVVSKFRVLSVLYKEDDYDRGWSVKIRREMEGKDFLRLYSYSRRDAIIVVALMELTEDESESIFDFFLAESDAQERFLVQVDVLSLLGVGDY